MAAKTGPEQLNEALVLRSVTEFQGFNRNLLDLVTLQIVRGAGCQAPYELDVVSAMTRNRLIDRGNPRLDAIVADANAIGVTHLGQQMQAYNVKHADDVRTLASLVQLRNALVHDDEIAVLDLAQPGVRPTVRFVAASMAALNRHARALDQVLCGITWQVISRTMRPGRCEVTDFKRGDRVLVLRGSGYVPGTVLSAIGDGIVRVKVEFPGEDDTPDVRVVPVRAAIVRAAA